MDPMMLMGLLQMGGGAMQSASNTALGAVPMVVSMFDRLRARTDPLMRQLGGIVADRYNQSVTENPYGDVYGSWGGAFGENDAGNPIGAGEAQARAIMGMMGQNPASSTIANYQQLAGAQRPEVTNSAAGLQSLMGHAPAQSTYQQPKVNLQTPDQSVVNRTNFEGSPAPRDTSDQTIDPRLASGGLLARIQASLGMAGGNGEGLNLGGGGGQGGGLPYGGAGLNLMSNVLPMLLQANQNYQGGYGTGGLLRHAFTPGRRTGGGTPSFASGIPNVPYDMTAKIHAGEAVIPAAQNPFAQGGVSGGMSGGIGGGVQTMVPQGKLPSAFTGVGGGVGGGVSGGLSGGGGGQATDPQSLMQLLIGQGGQAITPEMLQRMNTASTDRLQNEYGAMQRNAYNQNAMMGGVGGNVDQTGMNMFLAGQGNQVQNQNAITAANTNWQSLLQGAGLQLSGEQAAAQQGLAQSQFEQQLYGQDISQWANIINAMNAAGQQGQGNQLSLWQQLMGNVQGGINQSNPFLNALMGRAAWQINPSGQYPMIQNGYGVGGGGQGGGNSFGNALGYWGSQGFPGMQ